MSKRSRPMPVEPSTWWHVSVFRVTLSWRSFFWQPDAGLAVKISVNRKVPDFLHFVYRPSCPAVIGPADSSNRFEQLVSLSPAGCSISFSAPFWSSDLLFWIRSCSWRSVSVAIYRHVSLTPIPFDRLDILKNWPKEFTTPFVKIAEKFSIFVFWFHYVPVCKKNWCCHFCIVNKMNTTCQNLMSLFITFLWWVQSINNDPSVAS